MLHPTRRAHERWNHFHKCVEEKRNFVKAKEMIFNVKPGATPRESKYLALNRTVGFSFLQKNNIFILDNTLALIELSLTFKISDKLWLSVEQNWHLVLQCNILRTIFQKEGRIFLYFILRSSSLLWCKAIQGRLPAKIKNPSRPGIGELVISYKSH